MSGSTSHVSGHAVLRYLTRILGLSLAPVIRARGRTLRNLALARAACAHYRLDFDRVVFDICPPELVAVLMSGATRIRRGDMVLQVDRGVVVTVMERRANPQGRKVMSQAEARRNRGRIERRYRP